MEENNLRYFSMFSGIGGFDLALNRQGHRCIGYSEINKYSVKTYQKNFGQEVKNYGDATKINPTELPDFDFLCGGFPCQAFSIAGKRRGFGDTRGTLFFEIARILEAKRPSYFLLENVKGLLNHNKGETFKVIIQTLDELGYNTQWMVFNSKFFGVPQNRERVFIIGNIRGKSRPEILPFTRESERIIEGTKQTTIRTLTAGGHSGGLHSSMSLIISHSPRYGDPARGTGLLTPDREEKRQKGMSIRRLTPLECERLQGFPDNWTEGVSDTQRYSQCGNAVTVNVIEAIIKRMLY